MNDNQDFDELNIRKKKDKLLSKHFDILLNGEKTKVANFIFKEMSHLGRQGKIIQLISKFNLNIAERENVTIEIKNINSKIFIVGDWCSAVFGNGVFQVSYWINEFNEVAIQR